MMALFSVDAIRASKGRMAVEGLGSSTGAIRVQTGTSQCVFPLHCRHVEWRERAEHSEEMNLENIDEMGQ